MGGGVSLAPIREDEASASTHLRLCEAELREHNQKTTMAFMEGQGGVREFGSPSSGAPNRALNSIRRRSYTDKDKGIPKRNSFTMIGGGGGGGGGSARRFSRQHVRRTAELPPQVLALLEKVGASSAPDSQTSERTSKLIAHIFDCLGALQHLVKANHQDLDIFTVTEDETQSVMDVNAKSVGKLLHEMITIYGLCGDTLSALVEVEPRSALVEDSFGRLALHLAVDRDRPWLAVIEDLVETNPESLNTRDGSGRLPLHVAVDRQEPSIDVVTFLLDAFPEAASARRGVGRLPIHYAVFSEVPNLEVVRSLLHAFPEGAQTTDVYGRLPLHYAVDKNELPVDVVACLLEHYPEGAAVQDTHCRLPISIAADREKLRMDVIVALHTAFKDGLLLPGPGGKLPLHLAVSSAKPFYPCIHYLAKECPLAILTPTKAEKNDSPLELALAANRHEVVRILLNVIPLHMPEKLADLNWSARRMAMLLSRQASPSLPNTEEAKKEGGAAPGGEEEDDGGEGVEGKRVGEGSDLLTPLVASPRVASPRASPTPQIVNLPLIRPSLIKSGSSCSNNGGSSSSKTNNPEQQPEREKIPLLSSTPYAIQLTTSNLLLSAGLHPPRVPRLGGAPSPGERSSFQFESISARRRAGSILSIGAASDTEYNGGQNNDDIVHINLYRKLYEVDADAFRLAVLYL